MCVGVYTRACPFTAVALGLGCATGTAGTLKRIVEGGSMRITTDTSESLAMRHSVVVGLQQLQKLPQPELAHHLPGGRFIGNAHHAARHSVTHLVVDPMHEAQGLNPVAAVHA